MVAVICQVIFLDKILRLGLDKERILIDNFVEMFYNEYIHSFRQVSMFKIFSKNDSLNKIICKQHG